MRTLFPILRLFPLLLVAVAVGSGVLHATVDDALSYAYEAALP